MSSSTTANTTTSDETMTATTGRARMAPAVAIAADTPQIGNARGQWSGPFPAEFEPDERDVIYHRPEYQIGDDNRCQAEEHERGRQVQLFCRDNPEKATKKHDSDLDIHFRPNRFMHPRGERRQEIADDQSHDQGDNEAAFSRKPQRPADPEFLQIGRRVHREIGVATNDPADIADPEYRGESESKPSYVGAQNRGTYRHQHQQPHVGGDERADTAQAGIRFRYRRERFAQVRPYGGSDHPAEKVQTAER